MAARGFIGWNLKVNLLLFATVKIASRRIAGTEEAVITILWPFHMLEYVLKQITCKMQTIFCTIQIVTQC